MMTRELYARVGGLDERFGLGFFDDDDLAQRARQAGYQLAVAHDLFVHHFGSRTFAGLGIDAQKLLRSNMRAYAQKWGPDAVAGLREVEITPWAPRSQNGDRHLEDSEPVPNLLSPEAPRPQNGDRHLEDSEPVPNLLKRQVRVSLTMIVRNEEANLPKCLSSVAGVFDEIVVVDTGSTDRTREIAREHGARVFDFVWVDDFAAARNTALARATGDYAFWLDADDVLDPREREKLVRLLASLRPGHETGFVVRCACDPDETGGGGQTVVDHVRLFPVRESVRWTYRVHEQILPALRRAGVPIRWTDLTVRHTGYSDCVTRLRKLDRDELILLSQLEEQPSEPFTLFNLGSIAIERQDWAAALDYLRASLAASAPDDSITRKTHALISRAHQGQGNFSAALAACERGLADEPDDAELHFRKAVVHRMLNEPAAAETCWRRVLMLRRPERFSSVDQGIYGHLTRRNLGALAAMRGDRAESIRQWRAVLGECPGDAEAIARLVEMEKVDGSPA
jgi:GT2 family glycosyltransferase